MTWSGREEFRLSGLSTQSWLRLDATQHVRWYLLFSAGWIGHRAGRQALVGGSRERGPAKL